MVMFGYVNDVGIFRNVETLVRNCRWMGGTNTKRLEAKHIISNFPEMLSLTQQFV